MSFHLRTQIAVALALALASGAADAATVRTALVDPVDAAPRTMSLVSAKRDSGPTSTAGAEFARIEAGAVPGLALRAGPVASPMAAKAILTVQSIGRSGAIASAADNDYTRLNAALQSVPASTTIELDGTFDWKEPFARAAWQLGSDGIAGTGDDWSIVPAPGRSNVTVTAAGAPGSARIVGPGDIDTVDLEGVFSLAGGGYQGWSFRNLEIEGFDLSIGMFCCEAGSTVNDFQNVQVTGNRIVVATDAAPIAPSTDSFQNIGIHLSFGRNQLISGNHIVLDASGNGAGAAASSMVGLQSNTSGGTAYDGLVIEHNTVDVIGAPAAVPARVRGLWENSHAHLSDIRVRANRVTSAVPGNVATNSRVGLRITSHSSDTTTVSYAGNFVSGMQTGYEWIDGIAPAVTTRPLQFDGNTALANGIGMLVRSSAGNTVRVSAHHNRIALDVVAGIHNGAGTATVDASRNWWGCNAGANAPGCDATVGVVDASDWLTFRLTPSALIVPPSTPVTLATDVNRTSTGSEIAATTRFPDGTPIVYGTSAGNIVPTVAATSGGAATATFSSAVPLNADVTATLDNQTLGARIVVTGGVSTLCVPSSFSPRCDIAFPTIATAMDAAQPGFTILLDALTYDEQVVVDVADLTIEGQGRAQTRIAPSTLVANTSSLTSGMPYAAIVLANAVDGTVIRDLAIDGDPGAASINGCTPGIAGAFFRGASGRIDDSAIDNVVLPPALVGCQAQLAVLAQTPVGGADTVTLDGNLIRNYGKGGVVANGAGLTLTAIDNTVTGRGPRPLGDAAQNGIQVSRGAVGTLTGNTVSGHSYTPPGTVATGVLVFQANANLSGNILEDNQVGVYYIDGNGNVDGNTITASAAGTGVTAFWGAVFDDPPANRMPQLVEAGSAASKSVKGAGPAPIIGRFTGNRIVGDGAAGSIGLEADAGYGAANVDFAATGNEIRRWGKGVSLVDCGAGAGCTASDFVAVDLHCNRIAGNGVGLHADVNLTVDAENNWWGCSEGPVFGQCNGLDVQGASALDIAPWLVMTHTAERNDLLIGQTVGLTADLNHNSNGVDVSSTCTIPATAVGFTTTLGTITPVAITSDGVASNSYTGSVAGTATVTATLDQDAQSLDLQVSEATDLLLKDSFEDQ